MQTLSHALRAKLFASLGLASVACAARRLEGPPQVKPVVSAAPLAAAADLPKPSPTPSSQVLEAPPALLLANQRLIDCGKDSFVDSVCRPQGAELRFHYEPPFERCTLSDTFDPALSRRALVSERGKKHPRMCCYSICSAKETAAGIAPFPSKTDPPSRDQEDCEGIFIEGNCARPDVWTGRRHYATPFDGCAQSDRFALEQSRREGLCCYAAFCQPHPRGRALRDGDGSICLPDVALHLLNDPKGEPAWWLDTARAEHASIAAFKRLSFELRALDAPRALIVECARAESDEIAHAEIAFAIAGSLAGSEVAPGRYQKDFRRTLPTLRALTVETLVDGCIGEAASVLVLLAKAECEADVRIANVLKRMAEDETRHSAFAWRLVEWAIEKDASLIEPLEGALHKETQELRLACENRVDPVPNADLLAQLETVRNVALPIFDALSMRSGSGLVLRQPTLATQNESSRCVA